MHYVMKNSSSFGSSCSSYRSMCSTSFSAFKEPTPMSEHMDKTRKRYEHEPENITTDDELQPQWRALENRVNNQRSLKVGEGKSGRGPRRASAWDHEHV